MTNGRVEVITSVERRRRWSAAEKERLVTATLELGASVSAIAREAGIHPGQLYGWRRQLRARPGIGFAPVQIAGELVPVCPVAWPATVRSRSSSRAARGCGSGARSMRER
jgi:transposase